MEKIYSGYDPQTKTIFLTVAKKHNVSQAEEIPDGYYGHLFYQDKKTYIFTLINMKRFDWAMENAPNIDWDKVRAEQILATIPMME